MKSDSRPRKFKQKMADSVPRQMSVRAVQEHEVSTRKVPVTLPKFPWKKSANG